MRNRRTTGAAALFLALALLFTACASQQKKPSQQDMVSVTDCAGRQVSIPKKCERIAALDAFSAEALVMAGVGEQMCSCPNKLRTDLILKDIYPGLEDVPVVKSNGAINIEGLTALDADVVLIKKNMLDNSEETAKLDKMGVPYLAVEYETMEEQIDALNLIGSVCGGRAETKMRQITDYYSKTIDLVKERAERIPEDKKIRVYHGINEIARTDGKQSLGADWITAVGAVNVSAGEDVNVNGTDYQATLEQIYAWDPDVVICNAADTVDYMYSDSKWKGLRAVREKQVKVIPVGAGRWGQRGSMETYFALLWLGCEIYPEYYDDISLKDEVVTFYRDVLGVEVDDELYEMILSGRGVRTGPTLSGGMNQ